MSEVALILSVVYIHPSELENPEPMSDMNSSFYPFPQHEVYDCKYSYFFSLPLSVKDSARI